MPKKPAAPGGPGAAASPREAGVQHASPTPTRERWKPAPARLRRAIARGDDVDYMALMAWWSNDCPERLRGLAPDTAALLSEAKQLKNGGMPLGISIAYTDPK